MSPRQSDLEGLLEYLKRTRGFDFTGYKRASLERRIVKRMQAVGCTSLGDYLDFLEVHPEEFPALFNAILINVTGFFRDAESWVALSERVVPALLARRAVGSTTRIWSAACASGEEAYTLAIIFAEALGVEAFQASVKIYATDLDEDALAKARLGSYSAAELGETPAHLVVKYFERNNDRFVFREDLRGQIIFGRHDLIQDAPISRVDLLVCRNILMYFNAETQARILGRFQFALNDDGILFLGRAETLMTHATTFVPIDLVHRISSKMPAAQRRTGPPLTGVGRVSWDASEGSPTDVETINEELQSMVEQLETANEQLATMNEELQSTNEELQTINDELRQRGNDLDQINGFLESILTSMRGAVMVLDAELRVLVWNQSAHELWGLREEAVRGRHLSELDMGLPIDRLRPHIRACLDGRRPYASATLAAVNRRGRAITCQATISPLLDRDHAIQGIILTTEVVAAEKRR